MLTSVATGFRLLHGYLYDRDAGMLKALKEDRADFTLLDQYGSDWVNLCFDDRIPFWLAKHGVLALQTEFRHARFKLPRSWDCVSAWDATRQHHNRLPLDKMLLDFMSAVALSWGLEDDSKALHLIAFSVLIKVGFHALLRPGELIGLRAKDVNVSELWDARQYLVIAIASPKTRRFGGGHQHVFIRDPSCVAWMRWRTKDLHPIVKLWPSTSHMYRAWFSRVLSRCGLGDFRFTPGSLRAGGTTFMVTEGIDLTRIQFLGRWKSNNSLNVYVQEAMTSLTWIRLSESLKAQIRLTVMESTQISYLPPVAPWWFLFSRSVQWRCTVRNRKL